MQQDIPIHACTWLYSSSSSVQYNSSSLLEVSRVHVVSEPVLTVQTCIIRMLCQAYSKSIGLLPVVFSVRSAKGVQVFDTHVL